MRAADAFACDGPVAPAPGQARIGATIARVATELMRSLAKPDLFERLGELTASALDADAAGIFLRDGNSRSLLPVARHGDALRFTCLADERHPVALEVARRLKHETVFEIAVPGEAGAEPRPARWLCITLRRGRRLAGLVIVGRTTAPKPFSSDDLAIAVGVGQLASLTLENARLLSEVERANRVKSDFVATMSHELRTPLNIILGYVSLLLEGDFGSLSGEQSSALDKVHRSAHALLEMVQDTLDLSRLEREALPISRREIDVRELLGSLEREAERMPRAHTVNLEWRVDDALPALQSDPGKLKIVLRGLLSNAFKFTTCGSVKVSARARAAGIEFSIADTGIGVPGSCFSRIFEPFTQLGDPATRTHGGVGMGLYVARRMTELLGGTIAVSSRVGLGSSFQVWIPAAAPTATFDPATQAGLHG